MIPGVNYVIWLRLGESNSRSITILELNKDNINAVAVVTHDRVIDDNLKRQIKNRPLRTCRLFLLT